MVTKTDIIKKDISWLFAKSPIIKNVVEEFSKREVFKDGGYIAGGFLRRAILIPQEKLIEQTKNIPFDIDIFCLDKVASDKVIKKLGLKEDSMLRFAKQKHLIRLSDDDDVPRTKVQCVIKAFGTPEEILTDFDLYNSMIACDDKYVYMHKDWEQLEESKEIKVNKYNHFTIGRILKYHLYSGAGLSEQTKMDMIVFIHGVINKKEEENSLKRQNYNLNILISSSTRPKADFSDSVIERTKSIIKNTELLEIKDVVSFINRLGIIYVHEGDYSQFGHSYKSVKKDFILDIIQRRDYYIKRFKEGYGKIFN